MTLKKLNGLVSVLLLLFVIWPVRSVRAQSQTPTPAGLLAAVNELRLANGLTALRSDPDLMASAKSHSQYQASIHSFSHSGSDGSDETERAIAAGYGNGAAITCDEAVAMAGVATTLDYIVNTVWGDAAHQAILLSDLYSDAGAGVIQSDGNVYYTLVVCYSESDSPAPGTTARPSATPAVVPVETSTPREDGSVLHSVQPGQALYTIALAYNTTVDTLIAYNDLDAKNPIIYAGQTLLIQLPFTPTATLTITETSLPSTETPRPTATRIPVRPTRTPGPTLSATPPALIPALAGSEGMDRRTFGIGIIAISGLGLLIAILTAVRKK